MVEKFEESFGFLAAYLDSYVYLMHNLGYLVRVFPCPGVFFFVD